MQIDPKIDPSWKAVLASEFEQAYFTELKTFLLAEKAALPIYPKGADIFAAYNLTPYENVKVVILGQDPYHGPNQAHGLAFSVQRGIAHPPSLQNIFKELRDDIGCDVPQNGTLEAWAEQGVFLLNTVLTVRAGQAHSHKEQGWERFTDATIKALSDGREKLVFILWGRPAQMKASLIDASRHHIIVSPHPSPLSAYRGFFGSKPFSRTNAYLQSAGIAPIDWCLSDA
ncbi:uracil-DNA glycosylase [Sulfurimonas sp. HSL1-2]|uniref:uracil-DNA glycosylase n=1 Tax=Thiomicrolovo zhangzhouensis TaxID=3131933 RepID=UPI0031F7581D